MKQKINPLGIALGLGVGLAIALPISLLAAPQPTEVNAPGAASSVAPSVEPSTESSNTPSESQSDGSVTEGTKPASPGAAQSNASPANPQTESSSDTFLGTRPPPSATAPAEPQSASAPPNDIPQPTSSVTSLQTFYVSGQGSANCGDGTYVSGNVVIPRTDWRGFYADVYSATYLQESNGGRGTSGKIRGWDRASISSNWVQRSYSRNWTPTVEIRCVRLVTTVVTPSRSPSPTVTRATPTPTPTPTPTVPVLYFTHRGLGPSVGDDLRVGKRRVMCAEVRQNSFYVSGKVFYPGGEAPIPGGGSPNFPTESEFWEGLETVTYEVGFVVSSAGVIATGEKEVWTRAGTGMRWSQVHDLTEPWVPELEITCGYRE